MDKEECEHDYLVHFSKDDFIGKCLLCGDKRFFFIHTSGGKNR